MSEENLKINSNKPFFVNQFVNTVYGIIIGFGFANSLVRIECAAEGHSCAKDIGIGVPFSIAAVVFVIITICVYWWDWVENVGHRVMNDSREFAIDIAMLMSLNFLFFSYEHITIFAATFFVLSILNLLWVYNYRLSDYEALKSLNNYKSWSEYLNDKGKLAKNHIRRRVYGVALYSGCFLFIALLRPATTQQSVDSVFFGLFGLPDVPPEWIGHWVALTILACAGLFNRLWLYRDRFEKEE